MVQRFTFALPSLLWCDGLNWFNTIAFAGIRLQPQKRGVGYLTQALPALFFLPVALAACAQREIFPVSDMRVHTAQRSGQEDGITVLAITPTGKLEAVTA
jgi:hypothetical protein